MCFDGETGAWHDRAWLAPDGSFERWRGEVNTFGFQRHLVGDFEDGRIYDMRLDYYLDDQREIVRVRRMPSVEAMQQRIRHSLFRLRMDAGVGLDGGVSSPAWTRRCACAGRMMTAPTGPAKSGAVRGGLATRGGCVEWRMLGQSTAAVLRAAVLRSGAGALDGCLG